MTCLDQRAASPPEVQAAEEEERSPTECPSVLIQDLLEVADEQQGDDASNHESSGGNNVARDSAQSVTMKHVVDAETMRRAAWLGVTESAIVGWAQTCTRPLLALRLYEAGNAVQLAIIVIVHLWGGGATLGLWRRVVAGIAVACMGFNTFNIYVYGPAVLQNAVVMSIVLTYVAAVACANIAGYVVLDSNAVPLGHIATYTAVLVVLLFVAYFLSMFLLPQNNIGAIDSMLPPLWTATLQTIRSIDSYSDIGFSGMLLREAHADACKLSTTVTCQSVFSMGVAAIIFSALDFGVVVTLVLLGKQYHKRLDSTARRTGIALHALGACCEAGLIGIHVYRLISLRYSPLDVLFVVMSGLTTVIGLWTNILGIGRVLRSAQAIVPGVKRVSQALSKASGNAASQGAARIAPKGAAGKVAPDSVAPAIEAFRTPVAAPLTA